MPVEWRPIPGFSLFEASNDGRVRRIAYGFLTKGPRHPLPHIMKCRENGAGYFDACVQKDGESQKWWRVHRLVALAFLGEPPEGAYMVCHNDGDKQNNAPANLYWGTHQTNADDCKRHGAWDGIWQVREHPTAKLSVANVREIKRRRAAGEKIKAIAESHGLSQSTIGMITTGKNWAWVEVDQ